MLQKGGCSVVSDSPPPALLSWLRHQQLWAVFGAVFGLFLWHAHLFRQAVRLYCRHIQHHLLVDACSDFGMLLIATIAKVRKDRASSSDWSWPELFVSSKHAGILSRRAGVSSGLASLPWPPCVPSGLLWEPPPSSCFCCSIPSLGSQPSFRPFESMHFTPPQSVTWECYDEKCPLRWLLVALPQKSVSS